MSTSSENEYSPLSISSFTCSLSQRNQSGTLVNSVLPGEVMQTAESFIGLTMITAPSVSPDDPNGSAVLKELSLTGPGRDNVITTVRRREAEDSGEFVNSAYLLTAPYLMATDTTVTTDLFAKTDLFASEVVALHPSEEQLKEYGYGY